MGVNLRDKHILFIAPKFFDYENEIIKEFKRRGAMVYYVHEDIDTASLKEKIINKLPHQKQIDIRQRYFINKFKEVIPEDVEIDYVFGIRMDLLAEAALDYLRKTCTSAKFICYFWDSAKNMRNAQLVASYFDRVWTFDKNDALQNQNWHFRPLFFIDAYGNWEEQQEYNIDILFIGSIMPERASLFLWLRKFCDGNGLRLYTYFFCKNFVFFFNKLKQKVYRQIPNSVVHNRGLNKDELIGLMKDSRIVFDCSSPYQSGLTMRTIECFGAGKKMVTTNKTIVDYDFYNPQNILLFNASKSNELMDFVKKDNYSRPNMSLYEYYSIRGWINTIFEDL